jgi:prevent-host-death family protein
MVIAWPWSPKWPYYLYRNWIVVMNSFTVSATDFKAKCLALIEEMNRTKIPIVVTKRGKPIAKMYPARSEAEAPKSFVGSMKGTVRRYNDPFAPAIDPEEWNVLK